MRARRTSETIGGRGSEKGRLKPDFTGLPRFFKFGAAVVASEVAEGDGTIDLPLAKRSSFEAGWKMVADPDVNVAQVFSASMIAYGIVSTAFITMGAGIATDRDKSALSFTKNGTAIGGALGAGKGTRRA